MGKIHSGLVSVNFVVRTALRFFFCVTNRLLFAGVWDDRRMQLRATDHYYCRASVLTFLVSICHSCAARRIRMV